MLLECLIVLEVLIANLIPFADEALFVALSHMRIKLVRAEEALSTELAERMDAAFDLFWWRVFLAGSLMHGGKM